MTQRGNTGKMHKQLTDFFQRSPVWTPYKKVNRRKGLIKSLTSLKTGYISILDPRRGTIPGLLPLTACNILNLRANWWKSTDSHAKLKCMHALHILHKAFCKWIWVMHIIHYVRSSETSCNILQIIFLHRMHHNYSVSLKTNYTYCTFHFQYLKFL